MAEMAEMIPGLVLLVLGGSVLLSAATIYLPRRYDNLYLGFAGLVCALIASELAWGWLVITAAVAATLIALGGLSSTPGVIGFLALAAGWLGLAWNLRLSFKAGEVVEQALQHGLGPDYETQIPAPRRQLCSRRPGPGDWYRPVILKPQDVRVEKNINYRPGGVRNQLDIYLPKDPPGNGCPVLLQIHGGAWMIGQKGQQALPLMELMTRSGWICVDINYRLSPSVDMLVQIQDCKAALCWVREHGASYGMNTDFVAVTGGSAGGHLCSLMGITANLPALQPGQEHIDTSVQACVPFYGPEDLLFRHGQHPDRRLAQEFLHRRVLHESPERNPALWELMSPMSHIHAAAPPYMIVHGTIDSLVPVVDSLCFVEALRTVSTSPVVYAEIPGAEHAFDTFNSPRTRYVIGGVQRFLEWARAHHEQASGDGHPASREPAS